MSYTAVVFTWASLVPATHHGSHAESHAFVLVHHVSEQLGGCCHRDALLVAKLIDAALAGQQTFPEATVCGSSSHGTQQVGVDLNHLLHCLRRNVRARCGPRVHRNNNTMLELREAREGGEHITTMKLLPYHVIQIWRHQFFFFYTLESLTNKSMQDYIL